MSRLLSKDFLSGVMFIAFGLIALWFGRNLAMGTTVRMGPGYVPHMLAYIMMALGGIIVVVALVTPGEITEVLLNMVVLAILCIIVFKVGLSMNISVIRGIW